MAHKYKLSHHWFKAIKTSSFLSFWLLLSIFIFDQNFFCANCALQGTFNTVGYKRSSFIKSLNLRAGSTYTIKYL